MKVIIHNASVIIGIVVATILGIYGQGISYYLHERFPAIKLTTAITSVTFLSIGLYILIPILLVIFKKPNKIYLGACGLIGIPISIWSFFVFAMWIG